MTADIQKSIKNVLKNFKLHESTLSIIFGAITVVIIAALLFNVYRQNRTADISDTGGQTEQETPKETIGGVEVETKESGEKVPANLPETYTVEQGDHLWKIAEQHYGSGFNWVDIARANELNNPGQLAVGQTLELPEVGVRQPTVAEAQEEVEVQNPIEGDEYTVQKGDTLWDIAVRAYQDGYMWPEIARANNLENPNIIHVGTTLQIPRN